MRLFIIENVTGDVEASFIEKAEDEATKVWDLGHKEKNYVEGQVLLSHDN